MRHNWLFRGGRAGAGAVAGLALMLVLNSCGLEDLEVPDFEGPSTFATGIRMTASPDIIVADGFSSSLITANVSDSEGRPAGGREIFFSVSDINGNFADIGQLRSTGPDRGVGTGLVVRTDGSGAARVAYVSPPRTDLTANALVIVAARPVGEDSRGQLYRTVEIELRSAEPRLFPPNPANIPPTCGFTVEPSVGPFRVNQTILFQTTSFDTDGFIARYEWFFGDGTKEDKPDTNHVWRTTGNFIVAHIVTDNNGARSAACTANITVIP
jgi:PKD domain-containing protein